VPPLAENRVELVSENLDARYLEEVLQSKCFERAPKLRSLLVYLWENRNENISEYAIAVDGLGRNPDFESKIDATVRVQIARLRSFLRKYYEVEGNRSSNRLEIPLGTHQIQLVEVIAAAQVAGVAETIAETPLQFDTNTVDVVSPVFPASGRESTRGTFMVPILFVVIALLVSCLSLLLWMSRENGKNTAFSKQELPLFWKNITGNGKATRIVLPTPTFFAWEPGPGASTLVVRDLSVNDSSKLENSAQLADFEKRYGKPQTWRNYTFASDTFAAVRLARFLDSFGVQTQISSSVESPHEIIDYENVIAFGTTSSLTAYQSDLDRLSFKLGPYERYVIDKRLPTGSPPQFPVEQESASRLVVPGLIALVPRGISGNRILLVQGAETTALISYMTSENGMKEIAQAEADHGHTPFFEAIVLSEVNGGNPIQGRLVAFRPFVPVEPKQPK
jgi:hypothetical protein